MCPKLLLLAQTELDQDKAKLRECLSKMSAVERMMLSEVFTAKFRQAFAEERYTDLITYRLAMAQLTDFIISIEQESAA